VAASTTGQSKCQGFFEAVSLAHDISDLSRGDKLYYMVKATGREVGRAGDSAILNQSVLIKPAPNASPLK
jgi:hypothetical protein